MSSVCSIEVMEVFLFDEQAKKMTFGRVITARKNNEVAIQRDIFGFVIAYILDGCIIR